MNKVATTPLSESAWNAGAQSHRDAEPSAGSPASSPVTAGVGQIKGALKEWISAPPDSPLDHGRITSLIYAYRGLNDQARTRLLLELTSEFSFTEERIRRALNGYARAGPGLDRWHAVTEIQEAVTSPLLHRLTRLNAVPGGLQFLLDLRADVIRSVGEQPELFILDAELQRLFASWFDRGFLRLQEISWNSPAALLEKLIRHEAVHAVRSWNDLRDRLDNDRRCYGLFHPCMPGEPLVFVEIALVEDLTPSIQRLLDETTASTDPGLARVAMFYSISSTQPGLRGIGLGGLLIERALESLRRELPHLRAFVTLSPAPLFRSWLEGNAAAVSKLLTSEEQQTLCALAARGEPHTVLLAVLRAGDWHRAKETEVRLRPILLRMAAHYLLAVERGRPPRDPVARFHLENGAKIDQIHWLADTSKRGLDQSAGMMVSYRYEPGRVRRNQQAYAQTRVLKAAQRVRDFLRGT